MYAAERQRTMVTLITDRDRLSGNLLAEHDAVTAEAIRRDLAELERITQGDLDLLHGSTRPGPWHATPPPSDVVGTAAAGVPGTTIPTPSPVRPERVRVRELHLTKGT